MSRFVLHYPQFCLVTDPSAPHLLESVEQALAAGVTMLQLRGRELSAAQLYELALTLRPLCQHYRAAFIVNDRLDVGLAVGADGFQLGAHSLPLAVARRIVGETALLGASVHTIEEAQRAATRGADFLLAGTIYPSRSHLGEPASGIGLISAIKQALPNCPLLAIGGVTAHNAREAIEAGADGIAVISAILNAPDVTDAVHTLRRNFL